MNIPAKIMTSLRTRPHDWFWLVLLIVQGAAILLWESVGSDIFHGMIRENPDPLDREFYASIAAGMRTAMLIVLIVSAVGAWINLRFRNAVQLLRVKEGRIVLTLMAISAIIQLLFMLWLFPPPFSDSLFYIQHADRLFQTGSYRATDGSLTAFWPVGYPAFLAFLEFLGGDMLLWGRVANVIFSVAIVYFSWRLFSKELDRRGRLLLVAVLAFHPILLFGASPLMTELAFLACMMTALLLLIRRYESQRMRWLAAIALGLLFGVMAFVRPSGLLIAGAFLAARVFASERAERPHMPIVAAAVMLLTLLPWTARNFMILDHVVPVATNGGYNFLMGNHPGASGGLNFDFSYPTDENEAVASRDAYERGLRAIVNNPWDSLLRLPVKLLYSYRRGDATVLWSVKPVHEKLPHWLLAFFIYSANLAWYVLVGFGMVALMLGKTHIRARRIRMALLWLTGAVFLTIMLYVGGERYVIPLFPLHAFLFTRFFTIRA